MKLLILGFLLNSLVGFSFETRISQIDYPENSNDPVLVFTSAMGEVLEVNSDEVELLNELEFAKENLLNVDLETNLEFNSNAFDNRRHVLSLSVLNNEYEQEAALEELPPKTPMDGYVPTNIRSMNEAVKLFSTMRTRTKRRSQCFNRAYVWSHELYTDYRVKSKKIFIFYTARYTRTIDKKWWFHVAPMIVVNGQDIVLDREFTAKPLSVFDWETVFIQKIKYKTGSNERCVKSYTISDFYNKRNQATNYCNLIQTSMYYWGPNDLEALDRNGRETKNFTPGKLKEARKQAFRNYRDIWY